MKKSLLLLFATLTNLSAIAQTKVEINGIWYNLVAKQAEVTSGDTKYSGSITIPATVTYEGVNYYVTSIGEYAFLECRSLIGINIPESVTSIGILAFYCCNSLTNINIPEGVTSIERGTFSYCNNLTDINIPEGVTSIGASAFYYCNRLTDINIPESVTSIGEDAFWGCSSLTNINIPESVTNIGSGAFGLCNSLAAITIPRRMTSIESHTFNGCSKLTTITIPEGVTSIGIWAFSECSELTTVTIPEGVTSIGNAAFNQCSNLTTISLPKGVTSISGQTFSGCSSLTAITIPESVTSIEIGAFESCNSLTSITIPESVTNIEERTFSGCSSLTCITCKSVIPPMIGRYDTFDGINTSIPIYVPKGSIAAYKSANHWNKFTNFIEVESLKKCATPIINYLNEEVVFACETEGAIIKSEIKEYTSGKFEETRISLTPTYTVTAYATKEGYLTSEVATLTLCWVPCDENHEESDGILAIPSKPVLISARDGVLTLSGLAEGTEVTLYTTDGAMVAHQQSSAGEATFTVDTNQVYLVHIGDKVVKIGM